MNEMNTTLREAMRRVEVDDIATIEQHARSAIAGALEVTIMDDDRHVPMVVVDDTRDEEARLREEEISRAKTEADAQRQRDLDAAMADVVEVVARQRSRLGRRICSSHDGSTVRKIFDLLKQMNGDIESGFGV